MAEAPDEPTEECPNAVYCIQRDCRTSTKLECPTEYELDDNLKVDCKLFGCSKRTFAGKHPHKCDTKKTINGFKAFCRQEEVSEGDEWKVMGNDEAKRALGEWLFREVLFQHFPEDRPTARHFQGEDISQNIAHAFAYYYWLLATRVRDMPSYMFIYNGFLSQKTPDDATIRRIVETFLLKGSASDHPVNVQGATWKTAWGKCVEKAKETESDVVSEIVRLIQENVVVDTKKSSLFAGAKPMVTETKCGDVLKQSFGIVRGLFRRNFLMSASVAKEEWVKNQLNTFKTSEGGAKWEALKQRASSSAHLNYVDYEDAHMAPGSEDIISGRGFENGLRLGGNAYSDDHDSSRYRYQPFDDHAVSGSGSSLLIGGLVGASSVIIIVLIFCLGLAFGMVIYWGYSQKRALVKKRTKEAMRCIDDENSNA
eukprot:820187_1